MEESNAEDEDDDPILSQFSDEPSSIDSFPDESSTSSSSRDGRMQMPDTCPNGNNKRQIEEINTKTPEVRTKRARVSTSAVQTTLKSWLVKKDD